MRTCAYCGCIAAVVHLDHVVPRSRGGPDSPSNLVVACSSCNLSKSDRLPSEWLSVVPDAVADIEARVCAFVEVGVRTRRGRRRQSEEPHGSGDVRCDGCYRPIVARDDGRHWGFLRWWRMSERAPDGRGRVGAVRVVCIECNAGQNSKCSDIPLEYLAGQASVSAGMRLLRDWEFTDDDLEFVTATMHAMQFMRPAAIYADKIRLLQNMGVL